MLAFRHRLRRDINQILGKTCTFFWYAVCDSPTQEAEMKTGETVDDLGLYSTECCSVELTFDMGDTFCRCPKCHALCVWEFENEIFTLEDLEDSNVDAA
jgi:hypothetical protein